MIKLSSKIESSALGYAVSFMLLIGLFGASLIFLSSSHKRIESLYLQKDHLLINNYLGLKIGARSSQQELELVNLSGDTSKIKVKKWGAFRAVTNRTFNKGNTISRYAVTGVLYSEKLPALYFPSMNSKLKICGDSKIEGNVFLPENGIERGYIGNDRYSNDKLVYGKVFKAEKQLPGLKEGVLVKISQRDFFKEVDKIEMPESDSSFSFQNNTALISDLRGIEVTQRFGGNLIIHSFDSILVRSTAQLENVILVAPKIRFEKGFTGTVQVFASEKVLIEKDVQLKFPSSVMLIEEVFNSGRKRNGVYLAENVSVLGGILVHSVKPNFRRKIRLKIGENSTVGGIVYNTGETTLRGKVIGSLFTNSFFVNAGGGSYTNYLFNGKILSESLPDYFVYPDWLLPYEIKERKIIKCHS